MKKILLSIFLMIAISGCDSNWFNTLNEFSDRKLLFSCSTVFKVTDTKTKEVVKVGEIIFPFYVGDKFIEIDGNRYLITTNSHTTIEFKSKDMRPKLIGRFNLAAKTGTLEEKIDISDFLEKKKESVVLTYDRLKESTFTCK